MVIDEISRQNRSLGRVQFLQGKSIPLLSGFDAGRVSGAPITQGWLGPLTRTASLLLIGLAVPLEGDIAQHLGESAKAMDKLSALPAKEGGPASRHDDREARSHGKISVAIDAELHQLHQLLQTIGLDPRSRGMDLAETRDGRWLWMTVEEANAHTKPEASIDLSSLADPADDQASKP